MPLYNTNLDSRSFTCEQIEIVQEFECLKYETGNLIEENKICGLAYKLQNAEHMCIVEADNFEIKNG